MSNYLITYIDPIELSIISSNGYNKVITKHTYDNRVTELIKIINNHI